MENTERQKFEEGWKQAFEGAEATPSDAVWANIDIRLDNEKMKRRVVYYQRIAAASILFAVLLGIGGVRYLGDTSGNQLAEKQTPVVKKKEIENSELSQSSSTSQLAASANQENNLSANTRTREASLDDKNASNETQTGNKNDNDVIQKERSGQNSTPAKQSDKSFIASTDSPTGKTTRVSSVEQGVAHEQGIKEREERKLKSDNHSGKVGDEFNGQKSTTRPGNNTLLALAKIANDNAADKKANTDGEEHYRNDGGGANGEVKDLKTGDRAEKGTTGSNVSIAYQREEAGGLLHAERKTKGNSSIMEQTLFQRYMVSLPPQLARNELPQVRLMPEKKRELPAMPASFMASSNKKRKEEDLWLSLGASAGSYNPGSARNASLYSAPMANSSSSMASLSNQKSSSQSDRTSAGSSYSFGFSFGKKIAERWVLHSGINYLNQTTGFTSNFVTSTANNQSKAYTADYLSSVASSSLTVTQPYKVNSSLEFVSIPVQTGYLLIDHRFGMQLNAGVATDIFLRNTLKDQSGRSDKYSQGSGSGSPYRTLNWAGLAGTELSYKIGKQYRLALVPGMRYSFQPSQKAQATGNPFVLDIGFRFKYIFE